ncbi:MAG TPA: Ig-like domain-containing protein, partial [Mycobacteriales bacterium]|nr:Ig-like domain-containing protein [Mycobacteriales bacterium]
MRVTRASVVTAVLSGAAVCAGPLVGVALATPALTSSNPANGAVYTSTAAVPAVLKVTYNETLNSPTSPVFPSHISVTLNGAFFGCTAGLDTDQKTLTCTPYAGTVYTDGVYVISTTASPSVTTGDTTAAHDSVSFTVDTTPPTITNRTPAPDSRVQPPSSVVATYAEKLSAAGSAITVTNSIGNVVGGASAVTNPTSTTGGITWIPDAPLPSGLFNVSAQATDLHGLVSTSTWQFTVDADPPSPPVVVVPAYVNAANENHVPITGTAVNDTGGAVKVRVTASDGATTLTLPDVNVGNDGSWSAAPVADLSGLKDGPVTITAKAIDAAGNLSTDSTPQASTKDTAAPTPPPSVTFPDATVVNASNSTLHVHGVTEPDAGVSVVATDKNATATAPVTTTASHSDGSYDAVIDTASLADGTLTITSTATDAAGNTSTGSNTIQKDATPSGTPVITVFDPVNASNVGTPRPVSGTATAGDHVDVWLTDATDTATKVSEQPNVLVQPDGSWSTTVDASTLADGPITVHAVDIDGGGNPSAEATKVTVKDTVVPNAPAYTAPTWINNATQSAVTLSGTAEPGTTLHLVATDSGAGSQAVNLPVQSDGTWTTTPALDLHTFAEGAVTFAATVVDQAGNTSSSTPGNSTKDTQAPSAPAAPTLSGPASGTSVYTATGSGTTGDTEQVTMTSDGGAGSASGSGSVVSSAYSVPVDAASLADGTLSAVATETDPAGNTSAESPASTVVKDTTAPFSLVSTVPADGSSVQTTPTLSATFNEQLDLSQSSVTLKDSTGSVLPHNAMQLSADKKTISVSPSNNPLAESSGYQVTFAVTELSHDESLSPTVTFTVDRTAPAAPAITSIAPIASANATSTPVTGTAAEPGGTIKVTLTDGTHNATGSGVVAGDGTWTVPVDASTLNDGTVSGTATQTDAAGNESGDSAAAQATKDTVAPAAPTVAWSGAVTQHALSVVLSGTAEPNSTVRVNVDDNDASTVAVGAVTTATAGGSWSAPVDL